MVLSILHFEYFLLDAIDCLEELISEMISYVWHGMSPYSLARSLSLVVVAVQDWHLSSLRLCPFHLKLTEPDPFDVSAACVKTESAAASDRTGDNR